MGLPERRLRSALFADVTLVSAGDRIERVAGASGSMKALATTSWELMTQSYDTSPNKSQEKCRDLHGNCLPRRTRFG